MSRPNDPQVSLREFRKTQDFFIGIDSDGCEFDTMEVKHKECFIPNIIRFFGLGAVSKYARGHRAGDQRALREEQGPDGGRRPRRPPGRRGLRRALRPDRPRLGRRVVAAVLRGGPAPVPRRHLRGRLHGRAGRPVREAALRETTLENRVRPRQNRKRLRLILRFGDRCHRFFTSIR
jgi:hypothetical protein